MNYDPYAERYERQPPMPDTIADESNLEKFPRKKIKAWRTATQVAPWTQGKRINCIGRFCCCTVMITLFLIISIFLTLALYARPPNITIGDPAPPDTGSAIQVMNDGIAINMGVNISVWNPNFFSVYFTRLQADIFYPINNTAVGGGRQNNIAIKSMEATNFTFPFSIVYTFSKDPGSLILRDIAKKCGFGGNTKTDLTVSYAITLGLRILMVNISPVVRNNVQFPCPLQQADVERLLAQAGLNLGSILTGVETGNPGV